MEPREALETIAQYPLFVYETPNGPMVELETAEALRTIAKEALAEDTKEKQ